jgi:ketosteroid isomerase-like protein
MRRDLVERLYAALAAGDRTGVEAVLDPGFVATFSDGLPDGIGGSHEGADAIDAGWWAIGRRFDLRVEPEEFVETADGRLLVVGRYRGRVRATGAPVDALFTHLWAFGEDRLASLLQVTDTARWSVGEAR